ncbi:hypothetical protein H7F15_03875 [Pontibacter sp. Tf4]|uniref:hypothetical protein n=1 Tax=Pontibacter sp. Tf4 TaxID=2761620 RepID=UPI001629C18E|nr:hypothetical protein [Pontibacter sp. Tf4]MBB6610167.1 hypothetical protein [Pontibacter sp. Tf4]
MPIFNRIFDSPCTVRVYFGIMVAMVMFMRWIFFQVHIHKTIQRPASAGDDGYFSRSIVGLIRSYCRNRLTRIKVSILCLHTNSDKH